MIHDDFLSTEIVQKILEIKKYFQFSPQAFKVKYVGHLIILSFFCALRITRNLSKTHFKENRERLQIFKVF